MTTPDAIETKGELLFSALFKQLTSPFYSWCTKIEALRNKKEVGENVV